MPRNLIQNGATMLHDLNLLAFLSQIPNSKEKGPGHISVRKCIISPSDVTDVGGDEDTAIGPTRIGIFFGQQGITLAEKTVDNFTARGPATTTYPLILASLICF